MTRLLIIGSFQPTHMGAHFAHAAQALGLEHSTIDSARATSSSRWIHSVYWHLFDRRPMYLAQFSEMVLEACKQFQPSILLVTGLTPPNARILREIRQSGIKCVNYLTDDPWNPVVRRIWFSKALREYDIVFNPRKANLRQLEEIVPRVVYLPFGFAPEVHFVEPPPPGLREHYVCDVFFYGGADNDRRPYINALIDAGVNVQLYGGYWNRRRKTRPFYRGMANAQDLRYGSSAAKLTLCLVRRSNRDGHVMRTFEVPAMGAALLMEDTMDHRALFGDDDYAVSYFSTPETLVKKTKLLLNNSAHLDLMRQRARDLIVNGANSYHHRLQEIVAHVELM